MFKTLKKVLTSLMVVTIVGSNFANAASPNAGAIIGNQATASYTDGGGVVKTATSNLVETVIDQVGGVLVQDNQNKSVPVGGTVYFQHTIINTGNGTDTFNLSVADQNTGNINFTNLTIYPDQDQNGVPDNSTPVSVTPSLTSGSSYGVVIAASVSGSSVSGDIDTIKLEAISSFNGAELDSDIDTITVSNNAVVSVTKSLSETSGVSPSASPITVTFTYTNVGDKTASSFSIVDTLPAGMSYVPNSGVWSGLTGTALTDADDADEGGVSYKIVGNEVTAIVSGIAPGESGQVRFDVIIDSGVVPGNLNNIGVISYGDGNGGNIGPENTNTATYNVLQAAIISITDAGSSTDEDGSKNNKVSITTPVSQGSVVIFEDVVINQGNGSDVFELSVDSNNFPVGTTIQFLKEDGVTALTDTNGNTNPDTSLLLAGASFKFKIKVTLPSGLSGNNGGIGYTVVVKAISIFDGTKSDTVENILSSITASTVDLTNDNSISGGANAGNGLGQGPEVLPIVVNSSLPGANVSFNLFANNTSSNVEGYNIEASTDSTFSTISLPAGWDVVFKDALNNTINSTGSIAASGNMNITATVSTPVNQAPGQISLYFRVISTASGAADVIHNAIDILTVADLSINPDNNGQVFAGGTVTYVHNIVNNGNKSPELNGTIQITNSASWTSVIYWDQNSNGVIDSGEPVVTTINDIGGLLASESKQIIVKVFSPAGLNDGDNNTTTVTLINVTGEVNLSDNSVTDYSVIISGDITLSKFQAIDADCNGVEDVAFAQAAQSAKPGECIVYKVIAINTGTASASNLEINDATPPYTTYFDCAGSCSVATTGTVTAVPISGTGGLLTVQSTVLNPLSNMEIKFVVKIDE